MTDNEKCKGFWNMCGCSQCRASDRQLEADLEAGVKTKSQAMEELRSALNMPRAKDHD